MAISKTGKTLIIVTGIVIIFLLVSVIGIILLAESLGRPNVPENCTTS